MKSYFVSFTYPDGHTEDIDEVFASLERAVEYGKSLLNQVGATETFKKAGIRSKNNRAYFIVLEEDMEHRKIVFNSQGK